MLNERLAEVDHAPVHLPPGSRVADSEFFNFRSINSKFHLELADPRTAAAPLGQEEDEDAQLKELQAALAM